jgi:predicted CXXCH cytochrome family protein
MKRLLAVMVFLAIPAFAAGNKRAVIGSAHDLGPTGSGPVKSSVSDSCMFCHAPHNVLPAVTPLWDHQLSSQTYTGYTSSTYNSGIQTPGAGSSKLCLSCHDGTVAAGMTVALGSIATSGSMAPSAVFGTNLASGHPLGMTPVNDGQLAASLFSTPPSTKDTAVKLITGRVECTTCHEPHVPNNDAMQAAFLARSNSNGALCLACHDPSRPLPNVLSGWTTSAHATASNSAPSSLGVGPYGTVAADACSSCHGAHRNSAGIRNLKAAEESACSPCHSGANLSPALLNVMADFAKPYSHPANTVTGAHDAAESLPVNNMRHAECADCHNSHAASAQTGTALPPTVHAALSSVSGYDTVGRQMPATKEYQICLKCHGDSSNKPQNSAYQVYGRTPVRYPQGRLPTGYPVPPVMPPDPYNVRLQFTSTIGHNVMGSSIVTTANTTLRAYMLNIDGTNNTSRPLTTTTQLYCTDCHSSNQARAFNGTGPNGPHGSSYPHLLQMNLYQEPAGGGSGNSAAGRALCNKCHNVSSLGSPHGNHNSYGCTTCHDPHGVIGGTPTSNRAMINFDTGIISSGTTYFGYYYNGSTQKGCYVRCHGTGHNPQSY